MIGPNWYNQFDREKVPGRHSFNEEFSTQKLSHNLQPNKTKAQITHEHFAKYLKGKNKVGNYTIQGRKR